MWECRSAFRRYSTVIIAAMLVSVTFVFVTKNIDPSTDSDLGEALNADIEPEPLSPAITTRSVLVELFTGTWCPPCQGAEGALDKLADEYYRSELSILEYHRAFPPGSPDPFDAPGNDLRATYYGVGSYPTAFFDGMNSFVGGWPDPDSPAQYSNYKLRIDARLPVPSPLTITLNGTLGPATGTIKANITAIDNILPGMGNLKARFVVYEDHNYSYFTGGREYRLRFTVVANLAEEPITIAKEESLNFTKTFALDPAWDTNKLGAVAFVQSDMTREVLQSTSLNLSASSNKVDLTLTPSDISFSDPNPKDGETITINATVHNVGTIATPSDVYVTFFDGDPMMGGTQIGTDQNAGIIASGGTADVQMTWHTTGQEGPNEICVVADFANNIFEPENWNNNIAPKTIFVQPGPPPYALSWFPTGVGVPTTTNIIVQWNETMMWDSVNNSFSYTDGITTFYASDGVFMHDPITNTSTFDPTVDLLFGTLHAVTFNTTAMDARGNLLDQDQDGTGGEVGQDELFWVFTTTFDNPPTIEAWEPGGTSGQTYAQGDMVVVTWNATDESPLPPNPINITYGSGAVWNPVANDEADDSTYDWDTSAVPCPGTYWMNLTVYDSAGQEVYDLSNYSFDIVCPAEVLTVVGTAIASGNVNQGDTDVVMEQLTLTASAGTITVTDIQIDQTGTCTDADIAWVHLWDDVNDDGTLDIGDLLLDADIFVAGTLTFTGLTITVNAGTHENLLIVVDIALCPMNGCTLRLTLVNNTYVTVSAPDIVSTANFPINSNTLTVLGSCDTITVSGTALASGNVNPGQTNVAMEQLTMTVDANDAMITDIKIDQTGTATDADTGNIYLYDDVNDNGVLDIPSDLLLDTNTFSSATLTFTGLIYTVIFGTPENLLIVIDISSGATPGNTVCLTLVDNTYVTVTSPDSVSSTNFPISNCVTIVAPGGDTLTVLGIPKASGSVDPGDTAVLMEQLTLTAGSGSITVTDINIDQTGTGFDVDTANIYLYDDVNDNGTLDATDLLLDTQTYLSGTLTFTGLTYSVTLGTPENLLIVFDIAPGATGGATMQASLLNNGYITVVAPDTVSTANFPIVSNAITISTLDLLPIIEVWEPGAMTGESYTQGDMIVVTWTADDDNPLPANPINITYGSGTVWNTISTDEVDDGSYDWDTTSVPCPGTYWMNLSVYDSLGQTTYDKSNYSFDIFCPGNSPPTITAYEPGGSMGQSFTQGDLVTVTWLASDDNPLPVDPINITYGDPIGGWTTLAVDETNDATYDWDTSSVLCPGTYWMNISVYDDIGQTTFDVTNYSFDILCPDDYPTIEAWEPGGTAGQTYTKGDPVTVTWTAIDDYILPPNPINITYGDPIGGWTTVATFEMNDGIYAWDTTSVPCPGTYWMNLSVSDLIGQMTFDVSNNSFDMECPVDNPPTIEAWEPGGSMSQPHTQGDLVNVTWNAYDDNTLPSNPINITFGNPLFGWFPIANDEQNDGIYIWDTAGIPCPGWFWMNISVYDSIGQTTFDESNYSFPFLCPEVPPTIEAWEPGATSGQTYTQGDLIDVTWTADDNYMWPNSGNVVNISYGDPGGWTTIATYEQEDGLYPAWDTSSVQCPWTYWMNISVYDSIGQTSFDESNYSFEIICPDYDPVIEAWEPGGSSGQTYTQGDQISVTWTASDDNPLPANPINITYSSGAPPWTVISFNEANDGTYSWDTSSVQCPGTYSIRLSAYDSGGHEIFDVGNYSFVLICPIGSIAGTILDVNGDPLGGAYVSLRNSTGIELGNTTTNSTGKYRFDDLQEATGEYNITVGKDHYLTAIFDAINVTAGQTTPVDVTLHTNATISGRVVDNQDVPVAGATVELLNEDGDVIYTTTTDSSGNFVFTGIGYGNFRIRVNTAGFDLMTTDQIPVDKDNLNITVPDLVLSPEAEDDLMWLWLVIILLVIIILIIVLLVLWRKRRRAEHATTPIEEETAPAAVAPVPVVAAPAKPARTCKNCGKVLEPEYRLCPYCGSDQEEKEPEKTAAVLANVCASCGQPLEPEYALCPYCGAKRETEEPKDVEAAICQNCGEPLEPEYALCPYCGTKRTNEETGESEAPGADSCRNCGEPLEPEYALCPHCGTPR